MGERKIVVAPISEETREKADTLAYPELSKKKVCVASGSSEVGRYITSFLCNSGAAVTMLDPGVVAEGSVTCIRGDVGSSADCSKAVAGQDLVICAAGGDSRPLLHAAAKAGVERYVHLSDAGVVFDGASDVKQGDEGLPLVEPDVAAAVEKAVLEADGRGMTTCAVRPALLYGGGAKAIKDLVAGGGIRRLIGTGKNTVDVTYSGNAAHAVCLAAAKSSAEVQGKSFNVSDGEPVLYSELVRRVMNGLGYAEPASHLPYLLAVVLAQLLRLLVLLLSPVLELRPAITAARASREAFQQTYDTRRAREVLGYSPVWEFDEGLSLAIEASEGLRNPNATVVYTGPFTRDQVSKHCTMEDLWIIVDGKVYDVTAYVGSHPGGDAIGRFAGGDSSEGFHGPQHPSQAAEILEVYYLGELA